MGRTVATFGFPEEVGGKAIFARTATREYRPEEVDKALGAWVPQPENALTDSLSKLARSYGKAIRNVLCHGSWRAPAENGASLPLFVHKSLGIFETPVDLHFLRQVQAHASELACAVINSVAQAGIQFPGNSMPGIPIRTED